MSTTPDRIVNLISTWLAGRITDEDLEREIDRIGADGLAPDQAEAVVELREELDRGGPAKRADLERVARETLEAVALG
jgi:hypothetical protein